MKENSDLPLIIEEFIDVANEMCYYADLLWHKGYVQANGSNITVRVADNLLLATPSRITKMSIKPEDLVIVDMNGQHIFGKMTATSELSSHLAIYKVNPDTGAVIHSQPPYTSSYACSENFPMNLLTPEEVLWIDNMAFAPFTIPGSSEMTYQIETRSKGRFVLVLQNNGLMTWGETLRDAFWRTDVMENHCKIHNFIQSRGDTPREFTYRQMMMLQEMKRRHFK